MRGLELRKAATYQTPGTGAESVILSIHEQMQWADAECTVTRPSAGRTVCRRRSSIGYRACSSTCKT